MDPFQVRMDFLVLLKRLNASQQSIHKVLAFAMRHATKAADDLWDCIIAECSKTSLNARLNILFLLDAMLTDDSSGLSSPALAAVTYAPLAQRDLRSLILDSVVPDRNWDGIKLNAGSVQQILASWRTKRLFDAETIEDINAELDRRKEELQALPPSEKANLSKDRLPKSEIIRRIEEDRERHKRLRERIWILPPRSYMDAIPPRINAGVTSSTAAGLSLNSPASSGPGSSLSALTSPASPHDNNLSTSKDILQSIGIGIGAPRTAADPAAEASRAAGATSAAKSNVPPRKRRREDAGVPGGPEGVAESGVVRNEGSSNWVAARDRDLDPANIEFEDAWESTSDYNEDDIDSIAEEDSKWWGGKKAMKMQYAYGQDEASASSRALPNGLGTLDFQSAYAHGMQPPSDLRDHAFNSASGFRQHEQSASGRWNGRNVPERANGTDERGAWRGGGRGW